MPWGIAAAAAVGVAGSVVSGSMQSSATAKGQAQANAALEKGRADANTALAPYSSMGQASGLQEQNLLGLNGQDAATKAMSTFQASPGYQYQLAQGLQGVDAGAAAKGMLRSGGTLKAEQEYGSNLANQDFSAYFGRLNGLTSLGSNSAANLASADTGTATQIANTDASAAAAQSKIIGNEVSGVTKSIQGGLGSSGVQNSLSGLFSGGSSGDSAALAAASTPHSAQSYGPGFGS